MPLFRKLSWKCAQRGENQENPLKYHKLFKKKRNWKYIELRHLSTKDKSKQTGDWSFCHPRVRRNDFLEQWGNLRTSQYGIRFRRNLKLSIKPARVWTSKLNYCALTHYLLKEFLLWFVANQLFLYFLFTLSYSSYIAWRNLLQLLVNRGVNFLL